MYVALCAEAFLVALGWLAMFAFMRTATFAWVCILIHCMELDYDTALLHNYTTTLLHYYTTTLLHEGITSDLPK